MFLGKSFSFLSIIAPAFILFGANAQAQTSASTSDSSPGPGFTVSTQDEIESRIAKLTPKNYGEIRSLFSTEIPYRLECTPVGSPTQSVEPEDQKVLDRYSQAPENFELRFRLVEAGLGFDINLYQNVKQMPANVSDSQMSLAEVAPYMDSSEPGGTLGCTKGDTPEDQHSCKVLTAARKRAFRVEAEGYTPEGSLTQRFQIYPSTTDEMYVSMTTEVSLTKENTIRPDVRISQSQTTICLMVPAN